MKLECKFNYNKCNYSSVNILYIVVDANCKQGGHGVCHICNTK